MSSTRFHACERFDRCEVVERVGKSVVYVNPVPMGSKDWNRYLDATKEKLKYGEEVTSLVRCCTSFPVWPFLTIPGQLCPLWRHSPSSELRAFVRLFRPHRIIPNTLDPGLENLDWIAIDNIFKDCLSPRGKSIVESISKDVTKNISGHDLSVKLDSWAEMAGDGEKGDIALKNLEGGDEAVGVATMWMTADGKGLKKLPRIQEHLPESLKILLRNGISKVEAKVRPSAEERPPEESQPRSERSVETDEDFFDDRGNTAHRIFAGSSFIRSESSSAPAEEETGFHTPIPSPRKIQDSSRPLTASPAPPSAIFHREYTDWFKPITPPKQRLKPLPRIPKPNETTSVLSPSTKKANMIRSFTTSNPHPATMDNPILQTFLPTSNLAPTPSLASMSTASTISSIPTKRNGGTPPSANTIGRRERRRAEREERQRIALKLGRARPDLVSKEFTEKFFGPERGELR